MLLQHPENGTKRKQEIYKNGHNIPTTLTMKLKSKDFVFWINKIMSRIFKNLEYLT